MNLFVYGTLQNNEVVQALTGKEFEKLPFRLNGYRVALVRNEHFPGMVISDSDHANGFILRSVDPESYARICDWEDSRYTPVNLHVNVAGSETEVVTFVWQHPEQLSGVWDNESYRSGHMSECVQECIPKLYKK